MIIEWGTHRLQLVEGNITAQSVDVVMNAANSELAGGGGVDGAIHRAAGPSVMAETRQCYPDGCPTGQAVLSTAGLLPAKHIAHAVGPIWEGGHRGEPELLRSAFRQTLLLAESVEARSIACPALSTGVYGYPIDLAAETILAEIRDFLCERLQQTPPWDIRIVLFDAGAYAAFARVLEQMAD